MGENRFNIMNYLANFNPIIALALFMPTLTKNKLAQYTLPTALYVLLFGFHLTQLALYVTLITATWLANNTSTLKSFIATGIVWHVSNLYSLALHPDSTYIGALSYDAVMITATGVYLTAMLLVKNLMDRINFYGTTSRR